MDMKHKLTLLGSLVAILASLAVSLNVHRAAVQQQLALDAKAATAHIRVVAAEQAQAHQNALAVQQLQLNCQRGVAAYNLLTSSQRSKAIMPNCSLALK